MRAFFFLVFFIIRISYAASMPLPNSARESITTPCGHKFQKDLLKPVLGNSWKDDSGLLWGDIATDQNGQALMLEFEDASVYCDQIEARLPTKSEYDHLAIYLGDGSAEGYDGSLLPNLQGHVFWASTHSPLFDSQIYVFNGQDGSIHYLHQAKNASFRCVLGANEQYLR